MNLQCRSDISALAEKMVVVYPLYFSPLELNQEIMKNRYAVDVESTFLSKNIS